MHYGRELPSILHIFLTWHLIGFTTNVFGNLCVSNICSTGTLGLSCSEKSSIRVTEVRLEPTSPNLQKVRGNLQTLCNGRKYCAADGLRTLVPHCQVHVEGGGSPVVAVYYSCQSASMQMQQDIPGQPPDNLSFGDVTCGVAPEGEHSSTASSRLEDSGNDRSNRVVDPREANKKLKNVVSYVFLTVAVLATVIAISFIIGSYVKYYQAGQYHIESSERALLRKGEDTPMGSFPRGDDEEGPIIPRSDSDRSCSDSRKKGGRSSYSKRGGGTLEKDKSHLRNGGVTALSPSGTPTRSISGLYSAVAMETPRKSWASVGPASLDLDEDDDTRPSSSCRSQAASQQSSLKMEPMETHRVFTDRFSDDVEHYVVNNDEYAVVRKQTKGAEEIYATPLDNMELRHQFQVTTGPYYAKRQNTQRPTLAFTEQSKCVEWEDEYF